MTATKPTPFSSIWVDLRGATFEQGWLGAKGIKTLYLMAGDGSKPLLLLLHGVGSHVVAYARNLGSYFEHLWTAAIDHGWFLLGRDISQISGVRT